MRFLPDLDIEMEYKLLIIDYYEKFPTFLKITQRVSTLYTAVQNGRSDT